jgi:predicted alpha/beta superfamily hydrolase
MVAIRTALVCLFAASTASAAEPCTPGTARVETFQSTILNRAQTLRVWLPEGYDAPTNLQRRYPVLYLFDGQEVLPPCMERAWLPVEELVPGLIRSRKMPPIIVVGVDSGVHRSHEYLPYPNLFEEPGDIPAGKSIPEFMLREVIPQVQKYRVTANPAETGIGGISNGAVAALHVLLEHPEVFGLGFFESPMLHDGNGRLVRDSAFLARGPDRVYIGIGTEEVSGGGEQFTMNQRISVKEANHGLVKLAEDLANNLRRSAFNRPRVRLVKERGGRHDQPYWRHRFAPAMVFLFGS